MEQNDVMTVHVQETYLVIFKKLNPKENTTQKCLISELSERSFSSVKLFDLNLHELQSLHSRNLFVNYKNLETIQFTRNNFKIDKIIISLLQNNTNPLKYFYFNDKDTEQLPSGLLLNLTNLVTVDLQGNNLKNIPPDLFINNINLAYLILMNNSLTNLDLGIFKNCKNLIYINFAQNKFINFYPEYFILKISQLFNQTIYNETIYNNLFSNDINYSLLPSNLTHDNLLSYLNYDNIKKVKYLTMLAKQNYSQSKLYEFLFQQVIQLVIIDLTLNELEHIDIDWFVIFKNLEIIMLSSNNFTLESIPSGLFKNNKMLIQFYLQNNKQSLKTLPSGLFSNLTNLKKVYLSGNNLEYLPHELFLDNKNLIEIYLDKNLLTSLHLHIFKNCIMSMKMNFSYNRIVNIYQGYFITPDNWTTSSNEVFADLKNLEELNLVNNNLQTIENCQMDNLKTLRVAQFSYNNLTIKNDLKNGDKIKSPFRNWYSIKKLSLDNNRISDFW
ncbi:hypothetical protein HCN44_001137 [Aphidius gifuensis]|uniref:Uncharacterized protein n=1 Tax=Aphidius gifuensis TaxID=684658 RepID=A0A835CMM0_APHGI|nr:hypothetical protein HCN44_001137 [Aphidius gifuensis]